MHAVIASYPILLFMRIPHSIYTALLTLLCLSTLEAQTYYRGEEPSCTTPPDSTALLSLHVVGEGFFRNDEYASDLVADYTLPGYRLHTALAYRPTTQLPVELRLGLYHLYYWGATRYPAGLAYQDLPYWRGDGADYTRLRLLPSFRALIQPAPGWAVLLGQLQGGTKHRLLEPLYNPELQLTADPEVGLQIRYEGQQSRLDTWIDWQSFIFGGAQHPEAFVFGLSTSHTFTLRPSVPLRALRSWRKRQHTTVGAYSMSDPTPYTPGSIPPSVLSTTTPSPFLAIRYTSMQDSMRWAITSVESTMPATKAGDGSPPQDLAGDAGRASSVTSKGMTSSVRWASPLHRVSDERDPSTY